MDYSYWPEQATAPEAGEELSFQAALDNCGLAALVRGELRTLQVNLGRRCNLSCVHCHQQAGPAAVEVLSEAVAERVLEVIRASPRLQTVDLTGGEPELCSSLERLVRGAREAGCEIIVRTNLAIFKEPGYEHWPEFYAALGVHLLGSLPDYLGHNVDQQRGAGVFRRTIRALQQLNACGYGREGRGLQLDLVHNPLGTSLPGDQKALEQDYRQALGQRFGITFDKLLVITNVPVGRFDSWLCRGGVRTAYLRRLADRFNSATLARLSCRDQISVAWDGALYACDFNLGAGLRDGRRGGPRTIFELATLGELSGRPIATGTHCFACTAAAGSG